MILWLIRLQFFPPSVTHGNSHMQSCINPLCVGFRVFDQQTHDAVLSVSPNHDVERGLPNTVHHVQVTPRNLGQSRYALKGLPDDGQEWTWHENNC